MKKKPVIKSLDRMLRELKSIQKGFKALADLETTNGRLPEGMAAMAWESHREGIQACIDLLSVPQSTSCTPGPRETRTGVLE